MDLGRFTLLETAWIDLKDGLAGAASTVPLQHSIFEGHFPGYPVLPGVLQVELAAQTSGQLALALDDWRRLPVLAAVHDARFRNPLLPGDRAQVEARLLGQGSTYWRFACRVLKGERPTCEVELTLAATRFGSEAGRQAVLALSRSLGLAGAAAAVS